MAVEQHFWLRRLHSLSGIVPIGGFLAFHLYENYTATRGPMPHDRGPRGREDDCGNAQNCVRACPKSIPLTTAIAGMYRACTLRGLKKLFGTQVSGKRCQSE